MEPLKIPRASNTKLTSNADINYDTLLAMANQTLDTPMAPPVDQDQLDSASGMRDLGSLAAALSGAVRGAGSVGGKLPNDFGFDQIARDMGNSRTVDLQNRMALRKQQENDMLEAIKNTGIAEQARANKERRLKPVTPADRAIINAQLKKLFPDMDLSLPDKMTYGEIEDQPVLAQSLGMGGDRGGSSGLSFGDRMALENAKMGFQGAQNDANRGIAQGRLDDQGKRTQAILDEKEAEKQRKAGPLGKTAREIAQAELAKRKINVVIPEDITVGEYEKSILPLIKQGKDSSLTDYQAGKLKEDEEELLTPTQLQTQRRAFAGDLRKEKIPEAVDLVEKIEKILERNPKDIPGVGSTGALRGPASLLLDKDGQELRGLMTKQLNTLLNSRAGLAVTTGEFDRVAAELASNWWQSDENFVKQFNLMKAALGQVIINTWGGYGDQVKNAYMTQSIDTEGNKTVAGRNFGKWAAEVEDYVPGQKKSVPKTGTQSATPNIGTEVPGSNPTKSAAPPLKGQSKPTGNAAPALKKAPTSWKDF